MDLKNRAEFATSIACLFLSSLVMCSVSTVMASELAHLTITKGGYPKQ